MSSQGYWAVWLSVIEGKVVCEDYKNWWRKSV